MGAHESKQDPDDVELRDEGSKLYREFSKLSKGDKRVSLKTLRKSEAEKIGNERSSVDVDNLIMKTFPDEKEINFAGYLRFEILKGTNMSAKEEALESLFKTIDNGDGFLTPEELVTLEASLNRRISLEEAEKIIETFDENGDGKMDLEEFILYRTA